MIDLLFDKIINKSKYEKFNLRQNIVDKSKKLINISVSMECFTADFSQFCIRTIKIGGWMSTFESMPSISGILLKFLIFLRS